MTLPRFLLLLATLVLAACDNRHGSGLLFQCGSGERVFERADGSRYVAELDSSTVPLSPGAFPMEACGKR